MSDTYEERHGTEPTGDTGCEGLVPDPELITAEDIESARHCEIKIDGLPGQLPAGQYAVTFSGMEYSVGASRPVIRFRYAGELNDDATVKQPAAEQAEAEDWLLPPAELPEVYRTKDGRIITDAMIEGWAAEAEAGYDPDKFRERLSGIQILQGAAYKSAQRLSRDLETRDLATQIFKEGEAGIPAGWQAETEGWLPSREEERNQWPIMDLTRDADSPPQPPQQVPDLYQVSTVETINVSKLARVITEMLQGGLLSYEGLGLKLTPGGGRTAEQVERWLRS
jgi:hypothetical protein